MYVSSVQQLIVSGFVVGEGGSQQLVGLACIVANKTHCYLYDVYQRTKRVSTLNFMQMNK